MITLPASPVPKKNIPWLSIASIIVAISAIIWQRQSAVEQIKIAAETARIAKEQADLKTWQSKIEFERQQVAIHPVNYRLDFPIDTTGKLIPSKLPTFELINGSERTATEIDVRWELIGTDYGNVEGWNAIAPCEIAKQTLLPNEKVTIDTFPSSLKVVGDPANKADASTYYGYLYIEFRDYRESQKQETTYRVEVKHDKFERKISMHLSRPRKLNTGDAILERIK